MNIVYTQSGNTFSAFKVSASARGNILIAIINDKGLLSLQSEVSYDEMIELLKFCNLIATNFCKLLKNKSPN
ncbi:MAG: hypothetical protein LRY67_01835 [Gammaproteobacteria bacterium]|nr:hypothetical protein [Gammaproteobacteria bacterium]